MSEWHEYVLEEIAEPIKEGYNPNADDVRPYIGLEHIEQEKLRINSVALSSEITSNKFIFQDGDVLFGKLRPYFRKVCRPNFSGICSTDIWVMRAKPGFDQGWFFYFLANWNFINVANGGDGGTRMPRADWNFLKTTVWQVPTETEQRTIAEVLESLDEKNDLLRNQNKTLESLAETLFRQWFVEEAQEGCLEKQLGDFFQIRTGKKDANFSTDDGQYPFFTCSQKTLKAPSYSFDGNAILLAGNGDFSIKRYSGKFEAYQRTYVLMPYEQRFFGFLYTLMKFFLGDITGGHRGSVINFITKGMIENFPVKLPTTKVDNIEEWLRPFNDIYLLVDSNSAKIDTLERLRETLLPKLMSGEVRVKYEETV